MIYTHAAAAVLALAVGTTAGWQLRAWKAGHDEAAQLRADNTAALRRAETVDRAASDLEASRQAQRQRVRIITQEVDRVIDRPIYRDGVCLDADGLRLVAQAAAGADPGQPAPALPAASAPD